VKPHHGFGHCEVSKRLETMNLISFKRHRFPPDVIRHAVWLYFRFTLSIRDIEELLA
jgi:transposase-like protein